jgi:hypothetical protein
MQESELAIVTGRLWSEPWMLLAHPRLDIPAKRFSNLPHLLGLDIRNSVSLLVIGDISFLTEHVELANDR